MSKTTFADLGLSPEILEGITRLGFETPTPVQSEVIPVLLESARDVVALAQTGTGKTAAFGLPIVQTLGPAAAPQALVLCPTRELCMQIARDLQGFASCLPAIKVLAVYGGADIRPQLTALERGVQVVVATPGRMLDVLRRGRADLSGITRVVLDEADEMLNMGFVEDLEAILSEVPAGAQTLLFSATMPAEVAQISSKYMDDPVEITLGTLNAGAEDVSHEFYVVHAADRYRALRRIVDVYPRMYGIVFCRTRIETQQVADQLGVDGYDAEPLHGDLSQAQRDSVMKKFRERRVQVLVATDVAARGLDVTDLTHVINYNLPDELNIYTHRSGRTGRAGKEGVAVSIVHPREQFKIRRLEQVMRKEFRRRPVPTGDEISRARLVHLAERVRDHEATSELLDKHLEALCQLLAELPKEEVIKRFVSVELHRMLEFYRDAPDLNASAAPRAPYRKPEYGERRDARERRHPHKSGAMVELIMNVGSQNGLTPPLLMNLVNAADRGSNVDIGRIRIGLRHATFEVPTAMAQGVLDSFDRGKLDLHGRLIRVGMGGKPRGRHAPTAEPRRAPAAARHPAPPAPAGGSRKPWAKGRGPGGAKKRP
jgi:ATP-dependent RNA helicase DeaD